jgi:PIN domain nuclease of toxin-antitoxin system
MQQAVEFASLPGVRGPMDRLIVAAARAAGSRLVSSDGSLEGHGVEIVWD